jgi:hypothetical protein
MPTKVFLYCLVLLLRADYSKTLSPAMKETLLSVFLLVIEFSTIWKDLPGDIRDILKNSLPRSIPMTVD